MKITISGIGGVGKGTTAKLLSKKLKFKNISGGNFFREMAETEGMSLYNFEQYVKKNPKYDKRLDKMQKKYGEENDNFVLESRLGWYFVPDSLKIKLICEENTRLKRIIERDGLSMDITKKEEEKRLKSINLRYKKLYNINDWSNNQNFDFIVDTTNNNPQIVVNIILNHINKK